MREYDDYGEYRDDHIRLYTPVLQRVLILIAVIIAVPVLMWTVTTFVRSYVARPKVPVLQQVAASESPARAPVVSLAPSIPTRPADQAAAAPPRGDTGPALSDARTPGPDIKKGPPIALPSGDATATVPAVQSANTSPPIQTRPVQGSEPVVAAGPAGATAGNTAPAAAAASPIPRPAENTTVAAAPSSSDRGLAWPNPNSKSPPGFGPPAAATPAASTAPLLPRTATAEAAPPGEPLRGSIPLPRQRPTVYAVAAVTAVASSGAVPLPRVRPSGAPAEAASPVTIAPYNYEPGLAGN
jgi:hypothetical protein